MNPRPKFFEGKKIWYVTPWLTVYSYKNLSKTRNAATVRKCRERMKSLIDCRICCGCRYAFISRGGHNYCSDCCQAAYVEFRKFKCEPTGYQFISAARDWAYKQGIMIHRETINPHFPVPNLDAIKSNLTQTFDLMRKSVETQTWLVNSMPRVLRLPPYLDVKPRTLPRGRKRSTYANAA